LLFHLLILGFPKNGKPFLFLSDSNSCVKFFSTFFSDYNLMSSFLFSSSFQIYGSSLGYNNNNCTNDSSFYISFGSLLDNVKLPTYFIDIIKTNFIKSIELYTDSSISPESLVKQQFSTLDVGMFWIYMGESQKIFTLRDDLKIQEAIFSALSSLVSNIFNYKFTPQSNFYSNFNLKLSHISILFSLLIRCMPIHSSLINSLIFFCISLFIINPEPFGCKLDEFLFI
jgi:hypothetical protein